MKFKDKIRKTIRKFWKSKAGVMVTTATKVVMASVLGAAVLAGTAGIVVGTQPVVQSKVESMFNGEGAGAGGAVGGPGGATPMFAPVNANGDIDLMQWENIQPNNTISTTACENGAWLLAVGTSPTGTWELTGCGTYDANTLRYLHVGILATMPFKIEIYDAANDKTITSDGDFFPRFGNVASASAPAGTYTESLHTYGCYTWDGSALPDTVQVSSVKIIPQTAGILSLSTLKLTADATYSGTTPTVPAETGPSYTDPSLPAVLVDGNTTDYGNWRYTYSSSDNGWSVSAIAPSSPFGELCGMINGKPLVGFGYHGVEYCSGLTSVTIPGTVQSTGNYIFTGCQNLSSVTFPNSIRTIGFAVASSCNSLTSITIPDSVTSLGESFYNCSNLAVINLGKGVSSVRGFYGSAITSLTIPDTVKSFGTNAFAGCGYLTSITFPDSVQVLEQSAFAGCGLTSVNLGSGIKALGPNALKGCSNITTFTGGENIVSISEAGSVINGVAPVLFADTQWFANQPDGLVYLGKFMIGYKGEMPAGAQLTLRENTVGGNWKSLPAEKISSISIADTSSSLSSVSGILYDKDKTEFLFVPKALSGAITIPGSVMALKEKQFEGYTDLTSVTITDADVSFDIGKNAFRNCTGLTSVTLGKGVNNIDHYAFTLCSNLETFSVSSENEYFSSAGGILYNKEMTEPVYAPLCLSGAVAIPNGVTTIKYNSFSGCKNIASFNLPDSIVSVDSGSLDNTAWYNAQPDGMVYADNVAYKYKGVMPSGTTITLKPGTKGIASRAFYDCTGLTNIVIPDSVTFIGDDAFYNTAWYDTQPDGLVYVGKVAYSYKGTMPANTTITLKPDTTGIAGRAFEGFAGLTTVTIPDSVTSVGISAFASCSGLTEMTIPNSVTSIGEDAFSYCTGLTEIAIPNSVTIIGDCAFRGCTGLTEMTIPDSVVSIGDNAFNYCTNLRDVTLSSALKSIGTETFLECNLDRIVFPSNLTSIGARAFKGCKFLTEINIPGEVKHIGSGAFYGCTNLATVALADGIKQIGDSAFYGCSSITSVTIPGSETYVGESAFKGCGNLFEVTFSEGVRCIKANAFYQCNKLTNITLPSSVTSVGSSAFRYCSNLTSATILGNTPYFGSYAFKDCTSLTIYGGSGSVAEEQAAIIACPFVAI